MINTLDDYFSALDRIKNNRPLIVPKNTKISKDAVSLEAGREKGSIKKSRPVFHDLINLINTAIIEQRDARNSTKNKIIKSKNLLNECQFALDEALAREISLLRELYTLKKQLADRNGINVLPIRSGVKLG